MMDQDVMARLRGGDLEAYGEVVRQWHGHVRGFVALLGVTAAWQDEVIQDVFIEAWRIMDRYDLDRPFAPWLHGIARNVVRRHHSQRAQERRQVGLTQEWLLAHETEEVPEEPDAALRLRQCLERLPDHARELVRLRYEADLECTAIAARLGRNVDAVRMSLMRVRRILGQCIGTTP